MKRLLLFVSALAAVVAFRIARAAQPIHLEVYGDSLSAGFLSNTDVTAPPTWEEFGPIFSNIAFWKSSRKYKYLAALDQRPLAWIQTLAEQFSNEKKLDVTVSNLARSASKATELVLQIPEKLPQQIAGSKIFSFFFTGHNDICQRDLTPEALSKAVIDSYRDALLEWDKKHTGAQAFILPVSEINRVYDALNGYVWMKTDSASYSCNTSWGAIFPTCRNLYKRFQDGTLNTYFAPRLAALNTKLTELAKQLTEEMKNKSGNQFQIVNMREGEVPLDPKYFAIDCFHLSKLGQSEFGKLIYSKVSGDLGL